MIYRCFRCALVCGVALLAVAACDDPSTVGAGVGPNPLGGGEPKTLDVAPSSFDTVNEPSTTGNSNTLQSWRMLVGQVNDPLAGTITANGYFDVLGRATLPSDFYDLPPEQLTMQIKMVRSYIHGDTTGTVDLALYDLTEEMDVVGATADQTFPSEQVPIRTASYQANDSLVTIDVPTEWIADNIDVLRDTTDAGANFTENFHGFRLVAEGGDAVTGFGRSGIRLEFSGVPDSVSTVVYSTTSVFTHIERATPPASLPDRRVLVDGVGDDLQFTFDFGSAPLDTLSNAAVNRVDLILPVDTTAWNQNRPEHFVRPRAGIGYRMIATRSEGAPSCAEVNSAAASDTTCVLPLAQLLFPEAALVDATTGLVVFQESLLSGPVFASYRTEIAVGRSGSNTIGVGLPSTVPVAVYAPSTNDDENLPRASITVTPL